MVDRPGIESDASYRGASAVTPSDTTVLNCRAFYVGGAGNVTFTPYDGGAPVTLTACIVGTIYKIACFKIMAATTATLIVALF